MGCEEFTDTGELTALLADDALRACAKELAETIISEISVDVLADTTALERFIEADITKKEARLVAIEGQLVCLDTVSAVEGDGEAVKLALLASCRKPALVLEKARIESALAETALPARLDRIKAANEEMRCQRRSADLLIAIITEIETVPEPEPEPTFPCPAPSLIQMRPDTGRASFLQSVEIDGAGFLSGPEVTLGGVILMDVVVVDSTLITATVPAGVTLGRIDLKLTNLDTQFVTLKKAWLAF